MSYYRKLICASAISVLLFCTAAGSASAADGGYAGSFLRIGIGPRAQALGDAYTSVAEGAFVGYYNPAAVAVLPSTQFMASFSLLSLDRKFYALHFAQPLRPKGKAPRRGRLPGEIGRVESRHPGMAVRRKADLGTPDEPGVQYILRWETLPSNRDRPHPGKPPEPSMLRVYKVVGE